jgi:hypothetical protein
MLRDLILAGLRQLIAVLVQAADNIPVTDFDLRAELVHVVLARLPPGGRVGFHLFQAILARG